jgi:hypothetical protein
MNKPMGYDDTTASGGFTPVNLGGHYCTIKQVTETQSSTGKDMIVVLLDFAKQDEQAGYFTNQFNGDDRPDKKWPFAGSKWVMINDYNDPNKTSRQFKTFCTCVEKSNGCQIQWGGTNWGAQFKGKKIGAVYGAEEHEYDGRVSMRHVLKWFCNWDAVKDAKVPEAKLLTKISTAPAPAPAQIPDAFVNVADGVEEEIPF